MRSLFPRIFLSFWIAMTLIGAAFAVIYATSYPSERFERFRTLVHGAIRREAELAIETEEEGGDGAARLTAFEERTDIAVHLLHADGRTLGRGALPDRARGLAAEARRTGETGREDNGDSLIALPLGGEAGPWVAVARMHRPSPWMRAIDADTLPWRLLVVFLVSGLVALLLARYLTRPLRSLRRATQRFAEGDLSVRVGPELGSTDREIAALGREFDRMASRIEQLVLARQRLLQDVSHELNSPLARLRVALELARKKADPEAAAPLDRIEREAERLAELVSEILTLARLEEGGGPAMEEVDLHALVDEVARDAEYEAQSRGRHVAVTRSEPVLLRGNEELLRRAIENVVRNAVRFAPESTEVSIELQKNGKAVALRVRDHGPGVPEESLRDIFVPLYRVDPDRDRRTGGTGLGLAIAERAVRVHGGSVRAENADGGGLAVTIELPQGGGS
jgi:two-component system sensor histidine kinase CpxA